MRFACMRKQGRRRHGWRQDVMRGDCFVTGRWGARLRRSRRGGEEREGERLERDARLACKKGDEEEAEKQTNDVMRMEGNFPTSTPRPFCRGEMERQRDVPVSLIKRPPHAPTAISSRHSPASSYSVRSPISSFPLSSSSPSARAQHSSNQSSSLIQSSASPALMSERRPHHRLTRLTDRCLFDHHQPKCLRLLHSPAHVSLPAICMHADPTDQSERLPARLSTDEAKGSLGL
ncbi:hypothetical protein IWX90DRAFT_107920 [Phyllosticta citrichinensis]|uniref:Uncharacterized protein n=1 Tax=Phyllosticta citrichinensis TaxID=1130410 RepID=A0ABR1Y2Q5_9PEZI